MIFFKQFLPHKKHLIFQNSAIPCNDIIACLSCFPFGKNATQNQCDKHKPQQERKLTFKWKRRELMQIGVEEHLKKDRNEIALEKKRN